MHRRQLPLNPHLRAHCTDYFQRSMRICFILALLTLFFSSCVSTKSALPVATVQFKPVIEKKVIMAPLQLPQSAKLIIGAGGIYAAFLYYGTLQEDVFHYVAADGSKFKAAWFLQFLGELRKFLPRVHTTSDCIIIPIFSLLQRHLRMSLLAESV